MNERRMAAQQRSNRRSSRRSSYSPPRGGGADMGTVSTPTRKANPVLVARAEAEQRKTDETNRRIAASPLGQQQTANTQKQIARARAGVPTLKEKIISGGRTLAELKNARDILMGNWLGVGKNVLGTIGARKLGIPIGYNQGIGNPWSNPNLIYNETTGEFEDQLGNVVDTTMSGATQAKTFNTAQELMNLGAAEKGWFGPGLTKQGKSLDQFIEDAKLRQKAGKEQTGQAFYDWATDSARSGLYKGWKKHAPYIEGALKQGVLSETSDYSGQLPFKKGIDLANGGIVNLFKYGGFLG